MTKTTLVQIIGGSITRREPARPGAQGHPAKRFFARHDRGRPQFNPLTHTCRAIESLAEQDEDVRYDVTPKPLADVRAWAVGVIDSLADEKISAARTQGPGIAAVYDAQRAEMYEYMALSSSGQPTPATLFPILSSLVGSSVGASLSAVAETIRQRVTSEATRMGVINRARLDGKAAVAAAGTVEVVASAVESARAAIDGAQ